MIDAFISVLALQSLCYRADSHLSLLSLSSIVSLDRVRRALSLSTLSLSSLAVSDSVARDSLILILLAMCRFVSLLGARPSVTTLEDGDMR